MKKIITFTLALVFYLIGVDLILSFLYEPNSILRFVICLGLSCVLYGITYYLMLYLNNSNNFKIKLKILKTFLKQLFCFHKYEMTEEAKKIPALDCEGIETREHECKKCHKKVMMSQYTAM